MYKITSLIPYLLVFLMQVLICTYLIIYPSIVVKSDVNMNKKLSIIQLLLKKASKYNKESENKNFTRIFFDKSCYSNSLETIHNFKQFIHQNETQYYVQNNLNSHCLNFLFKVSV